MAPRRTLLATLLLTVAAVAGCSDESAVDPNLPDGATLIREAAATTAGIRSAHFTLDVTGTVPGVGLQNLDGDLTKDGGPSGAAKGSGRLELSGQLVEVEFVLVDEKIYVKGPTGGFQQLPVALGASVYDPSAVLDPDRGIAKILTGVTEPRTTAREDVDGTATLKVEGKVAGAALAGVLPGSPPDAEVSFWVREETGNLPVKASLSFPGSGDEPSTVDVTLSDVDKPVTVTPPA
ncbi:hypothetical protein CFN78_02340 [Amycolatopsis antarctica]|uniref:LppX_LprAFG lipoprotein n=1 Tax=Amycolatopsis antarctica TaxID=1854586 RepID=A0A263D955_9PSEU|nr:LppX_LprAFG lipoprotein [Amycolatopsis antarctica]OZM75042.1 hypothetical protein CFN78_02340 [Amycolatopsis antarctica]